MLLSNIILCTSGRPLHASANRLEDDEVAAYVEYLEAALEAALGEADSLAADLTHSSAMVDDLVARLAAVMVGLCVGVWVCGLLQAWLRSCSFGFQGSVCVAKCLRCQIYDIVPAHNPLTHSTPHPMGRTIMRVCAATWQRSGHAASRWKTGSLPSSRLPSSISPPSCPRPPRPRQRRRHLPPICASRANSRCVCLGWGGRRGTSVVRVVFAWTMWCKDGMFLSRILLDANQPRTANAHGQAALGARFQVAERALNDLRAQVAADDDARSKAMPAEPKRNRMYLCVCVCVFCWPFLLSFKCPPPPCFPHR